MIQLARHLILSISTTSAELETPRIYLAGVSVSLTAVKSPSRDMSTTDADADMFGAPCVAIALIPVYYFIRRSTCRRRRRKGRDSGFCPSSFAMGTVLLFALVF